jgi:hypothetical protein
MDLQPSQFYLAFARRICREERVGCVEEDPANTGPKTTVATVQLAAGQGEGR